MEPISNHARRAADERDARYYSESDLEDNVGVSVDNAYLVTGNDDGALIAGDYDGDFVMVITGITHTRDRVRSGQWYRPSELGEDEFFAGIRIEAEFYALHFENGAMTTHDEPFDSVTIPRAALRRFPRRKLQAASRENTWILQNANDI